MTRRGAEVASLMGQVIPNGNPRESPEMALANLHSPEPVEEN